MRLSRSRLWMFVLSVVLIVSVLSKAPWYISASTSTNLPTFTQSPCLFSTGNASMTEGKDYRCGVVTVPEDHSKPDNGKTISLAVAIFKAKTRKPDTSPVIYLDGGPGGFTLIYGGDYLRLFAPLLASHDLILFDQRGVGYSQPSLYCPELTDLYYKQMGEELSPEVAAKQSTDVTLACRQRLVKAGINLPVYTSAQNAADVDAIRQALGYETLNLYGISYGTRLALTVMRDFPTSVKSTVIDSVVPLEADMLADEIPNMERVFKQLWDACTADARCNKAYPNLEKIFYDTVDKLNKKPYTTTATSDNGKAYNVVIDGNSLIYFLFSTFYLTDTIPDLPAIIYAAKNGHFQTIASLLVSFTDENKTLSDGMYFSVECPEDTTFTTMQNVTAAAQDDPKQLLDLTLPSLQSEFDICRTWGSPPEPPIEHQAVKSSIPTLVMAGSFDPVTPPRYSQQVANELGNATYVEIPNSGHGASLAGSCPFTLVTAFFRDPGKKPNDACVKTIGPPKFIVTQIQ